MKIRGRKLGVRPRKAKIFSFRFSRSDPYALCLRGARRKGFILIDEFDTLENTEDKHNIAELIKLLSDYGSPFKIFIVGSPIQEIGGFKNSITFTTKIIKSFILLITPRNVLLCRSIR